MTHPVSTRRRIATLLAAILLAATTAGCSSGSSSHSIVFQVTGPAAADITYQVGGQQTQRIGQALPFSEPATTSDAPLIVVLTAQSKSDGDITCQLTIDGVAGTPVTSTGQFAIVTCTNG